MSNYICLTRGSPRVTQRVGWLKIWAKIYFLGLSVWSLMEPSWCACECYSCYKGCANQMYADEICSWREEKKATPKTFSVMCIWFPALCRDHSRVMRTQTLQVFQQWLPHPCWIFGRRSEACNPQSSFLFVTVLIVPWLEF